MSFKNKVVLITGASSGIGAATAILFAKEGAAVAILGRNQEKLKKVAEECKKYEAETLFIQADLTKDEELKTVVQKTIDKFKRLDVLVNNAGILNFASILDENLMEAFDRTMNNNLRSAVYLTHLAAPHLIKTKGNIVNISSVCAVSYINEPRYLPYAVSKAGMNNFTRGVALELASAGVRVNAINPGPVNTNILSSSNVGWSWKDVKEKFKIDRLSEPEEIADLILYLASDKAKSITGSNYCIDNGTLLNN